MGGAGQAEQGKSDALTRDRGSLPFVDVRLTEYVRHPLREHPGFVILKEVKTSGAIAVHKLTPVLCMIRGVSQWPEASIQATHLLFDKGSL